MTNKGKKRKAPGKKKAPARKHASPNAPTKPRLTVALVQAALQRAAAGADELNDQLREVFELSDSSATLRLR
jgi:hypothetical protein